MATYVFKAMDLAGVPARGEVEANSKQDVAEQLKERGLVVIDIAHKYRSREVNIELFARVKAGDLAVATRQLSTMVSSGMTILRALHVLEAQTESKMLKTTLASVRKDVGRPTALRRARASSEGVLAAVRLDGPCGGDRRRARAVAVAYGRPAREGRFAASPGARRDHLPIAGDHVCGDRAAGAGRVPDSGVRERVQAVRWPPAGAHAVHGHLLARDRQSVVSGDLRDRGAAHRLSLLQ